MKSLRGFILAFILIVAVIPASAQSYSSEYLEDLGYPLDQDAGNRTDSIQSITYFRGAEDEGTLADLPTGLRLFDRDGALVYSHMYVPQSHFYACTFDKADRVLSINELLAGHVIRRTEGHSSLVDMVELIQYDLRYNSSGQIATIMSGNRYGRCWQEYYDYDSRGQTSRVETIVENAVDGTHFCTSTDTYLRDKDRELFIVRDLRWKDSLINYCIYEYDSSG